MASQSELDTAHMDVARAHARLSKGERGKVGACLVTAHGVILGGCNGMAPGGSNVLEENDAFGNKVTKPEVIHAELSCLLKAAKEGVSVIDATLYTTMSCCVKCAEMIVAAGVSRVVYLESYRDEKGIEKLLDMGVMVDKMNTVTSCHTPDELKENK